MFSQNLLGGASRLDDTLVGMGWASDAANSLGLGADPVRGFTLQRHGRTTHPGQPRVPRRHADIGWMYLRDAAAVTVQLETTVAGVPQVQARCSSTAWCCNVL